MYGIEEKIIKWIKGKKADKVTAKKALNVEDGANDSENSQTQQTSTQTKSQESSKLTYNKLLDNLKGYNQKLDELSPSEEKVEPPVELTDSQIKNQVTLEVDSKYNDDYDALKKDLIKTTEEIKNEYGESVEKANKKQEQNTANYKESIEKAKNDALKKGISRSSIVENMLGEIDKQYQSNIKDIKAQLQNEINKSNEELKKADNDYKEAVSSLDVQKALEIKSKTQKIKDEQRKMLEDYYKNASNLGNHSAIDKDGNINQDVIDIYNKIITDTLNYYTSMPAKEALESFNADFEIKRLLGDYAKTIEEYLKSFN